MFQYGMLLLLSCTSLLLIILGDNSFSFILNIFLIIFLIINYIMDLSTLNYKKLLTQVNNKVPTFETTFKSNNIIVEAGDNKQEYSYELVKSVIEGEQILILKLPNRLGIIVDKNNMVEGSISDLKELVINKCNIKVHKAPRYINILKTISSILVIGIFCASLFLFISK